MLLNTLELFDKTKKLDVYIAYKGIVRIDNIEELSVALRSQMAFDKLSQDTFRAVFSIFVELMENVKMHSAVPKGCIIVTSQDKIYHVQSGNLMETQNIEELKKRINHLNSMDKQSLRNYYMERIKKNNPNPRSRGAGIGLIEIAKRASEPVEYDFIPYDEHLTFFTAKVTINNDNIERGAV
ncbi:MAG: SiaB family protein kinase [Lachnospiraceae bacterium]|nr:SiaB family protein kinase [Lachnospiraceae bacterium]